MTELYPLHFSVEIRNRYQRNGYTLIELVVSMASASVLTLGLASSLYIANRALTGDAGTAHRSRAAEIQNQMMVDLNLATSFDTTDPDAVEFSVPDRNNDSTDETITYTWTGLPDATLEYSYNGSAEVTILDNVQDFQFSYLQRSIPGAMPPVAVLDSTQWGERWAGGMSKFGYTDIFADAGTQKRKQIATKVTLAESGTLNSITAYLVTTIANDYRFAIYSHNAFKNEPGLLLAESGNGNGLANGWVTLSTPPTPLTAGTYWLALSYDDDAFSHREEAGGETEVYTYRPTQFGYAASWGNPSTSSNVKISIFANYMSD